MTPSQEEALYDFLDNSVKPFNLDDVVSCIRKVEPKRMSRLGLEVEAFFNQRNLAFPEGNRRWVSRRGFFEPFSFIISPTRLELVNGILIPGHRCVPFANSNLLPHEYTFFWQGSPVPFTTTEGSPEEFYPYYSIFGEEYAPQYVARDNSENEEAYNDDPFEEPSEVSIRTIDMRNIYREASFVPGDCFSVRTLDWKQGYFLLEKVGKDEWSSEDLDAWVEAAESGFEKSFANLGPASCTEEQVAYAYWYGGQRMRELPAHSLEDLLYKKTVRIEICAYGIETRFWYAGREIPDSKELDAGNTRPDKTLVEEMLARIKIPVSEYVVQSFIRDSLFRGERNEALIIDRLIPAPVEPDMREKNILIEYVRSVLTEFGGFYSPFRDKAIGPVRQRAGELHTAVIELSARLNKGGIDASWLPRHTFIVLSQIQSHTASVMEDLDFDEGLSEAELEALDNSLDSMIETYEDIKELIEDALDSYRRNKLAVVKSGSGQELIIEQLLQISIGGVDVWRRVIVPESLTLGELHLVIQTVFGWRNSDAFSFKFKGGEPGKLTSLGQLEAGNSDELLYEYGSKWSVRIMILSRYEASGAKPVRCVAGAGAAPPEFIGGPLKFRKVLSVLESGNDAEKHAAIKELGQDFIPWEFNLEACNRSLTAYINGGK